MRFLDLSEGAANLQEGADVAVFVESSLRALCAVFVLPFTSQFPSGAAFGSPV